MSLKFSRPIAGIFIAFVVLAIIGHSPSPAHAQAPAQNPSRLAKNADPAPPLAHQIGFFRKVLSRADGDRCTMHPSCSTYALESLRKHGALMGWIMASDRLLRCGHDEVQLAPKVRADQRHLAYDPVSGNDFWWWTPPEAASTTSP